MDIQTQREYADHVLTCIGYGFVNREAFIDGMIQAFNAESDSEDIKDFIKFLVIADMKHKGFDVEKEAKLADIMTEKLAEKDIAGFINWIRTADTSDFYDK